MTVESQKKARKTWYEKYGVFYYRIYYRKNKPARMAIQRKYRKNNEYKKNTNIID